VTITSLLTADSRPQATGMYTNDYMGLALHDDQLFIPGIPSLVATRLR